MTPDRDGIAMLDIDGGLGRNLEWDTFILLVAFFGFV